MIRHSNAEVEETAVQSDGDPLESRPEPDGAVLAWREIDLGAVAHNVRLLAARCEPADLMVVVKADGYSHGAVAVARAALAAGATRLGVAVLEEAFELRRQGIGAPILAWLAAPGAPYRTAIEHAIELAAHSGDQLEEIARAAQEAQRPAEVHLKAETGMWRGGAAGEWAALVARARRYEEDGRLLVRGIWSHLACADVPDHPANDAQRDAFTDAVATAHAAGLRPRFRHLANSAAALARPDLHFDLVRCGLAIYGVNPLSGRPAPVDLRPAMRVRGRVTLVKQAPEGVGVSYGHEYRTATATTLAVLPLGYADGVPTVGEPATVGWRGTSVRIAGRVCMDQVILDVGTLGVRPGDVITVLGPGDDGEQAAEQWAAWSGRSAYEMLTGFDRHRVPIRER